jgi:hypothetical protein
VSRSKRLVVCRFLVFSLLSGHFGHLKSGRGRNWLPGARLKRKCLKPTSQRILAILVNKLVALYPIGSAMCEIADSDVGEYKVQTMVIMFATAIPGRDAWPLLSGCQELNSGLRPYR